MANVTINSLTQINTGDLTSSHYFIADDGSSTTKFPALSAVIKTISTTGAGSQLIKSFGLGTLAQRSIVGGTGITATQNTDDITLSVSQGDININNLAGSLDLSTADNSSSLFLTSVNLASNVTGLLPLANGGTGKSSFLANSVVLGGTVLTEAVLDANLEVLVGTSNGPETKTLQASSPITVTQDNVADTLTIGFTKGNYVEQNDNAVLGNVTVNDLTVGSLTASAAGAVTQTTSLATAVSLNAIAGSITLFAAAITANTNTQFTVNNSTVTSTSVIFLSREFQSNVAANNGVHVSIASVSNGSFNINITHTGNQDAASIVRKIHFFVFG